jgi:hypothetical protein
LPSLRRVVFEFASNRASPANDKSSRLRHTRIMRMLCWISFAAFTAYCADTILYGGAHADTTVMLARNIARGILLGLMHYA